MLSLFCNIIGMNVCRLLAIHAKIRIFHFFQWHFLHSTDFMEVDVLRQKLPCLMELSIQPTVIEYRWI